MTAPDGTTLRYLAVDGLAAMRLAVGRPKDLRRAAELRALRPLRFSSPRIRGRPGSDPDAPGGATGARSWCRNPTTTPTRGTAVNDIHATFAAQGLVRPRDGRVLAGVVTGLGRRVGVDPWPARLLFVLVLMVIPGSQLLVYPLLWILMPSQDRVPAPAAAVPAPAGSAPPAAG